MMGWGSMEGNGLNEWVEWSIRDKGIQSSLLLVGVPDYDFGVCRSI